MSARGLHQKSQHTGQSHYSSGPVRKIIARGVALLVAAGLIAGCAVLSAPPEPSTLDERLAAFPTGDAPLKGTVSIYWDKHQVPFIEAEYDQDAAFALGLVHAHLRLGELELARYLSQGRIAEMVGPKAANADHVLRIIDFSYAVPEMVATLPPDTKRWLDAYVAGINHYQANVETLPHEFRVMNFDPDPWTVADVLTIGRAAAADANWAIWSTLLPLRKRADWSDLWRRILEKGSASTVSFDDMDFDDFKEAIGILRPSGSNAVAIAASRSRSGGALLASDPHLNFFLPNLWVIAGLKSPSYHVVGIMPATFPFWAIGRNPSIAWGGTNMRATSSALYDLSGIAAEEITERGETIRVRWWLDRDVKIRRTKWGPVLSDIPQLSKYIGPDVALQWMGYWPSDEVTAMLKANRATTFEEFREAFRTFGVPGMNMLYADKDGHIGQVQAVHVPWRPNEPPKDMIEKPAESRTDWARIFDATVLPASLDPVGGFVGSANNRPAGGDVPVGFIFSDDDRILRLKALLEGTGKVDLSDLKDIQQDVYMASSVELRDLLVDDIAAFWIDRTGTTDRAQLVLTLMRRWDGYYRVDSRGALAFELFREGFAEAFFGDRLRETDWSGLANVIGGNTIILDAIGRADRARLEPALRAGLVAAGRRIDDYSDWGDLHQLELAHPFAALPIVGDRYRFGKYRVGGSTSTLMKSTHEAAGGGPISRYGAMARFLSDLSDPNANYAILLGGQDGWINSENFIDQVPLWLKGEYLHLPLELDAVRAKAVHTTVLGP